MDFIERNNSTNGNGSSTSSSSSNDSNDSLALDKDSFMPQQQDYHPLSCMPPSNSSQNNKKNSIQDRLSNIFYTTSSMLAETTPMNVAALTKQHMTRASQMSNNGSTVASLMAKTKQVQLVYAIHDYSSHSGSYHPQHIMVNKPTQQASRWSSGLHDHAQFITIKFEKPVVARKFFSTFFGNFFSNCDTKVPLRSVNFTRAMSVT